MRGDEITMGEYIERKRVYAAVSRLLNQRSAADFTKYEEGFDDAVCEIMSIIKEFPAADVALVKHGEWSDKMVAVSDNGRIGYHSDDVHFGYCCSECGAVLNKTNYCGNCCAKMDKKPNDWISVPEQKPPKNLLVDTKIDDENGIRNEQQLIFHSNLWWFPDNSMYVYYTPTHWKYVDKMGGKDGENDG